LFGGTAVFLSTPPPPPLPAQLKENNCGFTFSRDKVDGFLEAFFYLFYKKVKFLEKIIFKVRIMRFSSRKDVKVSHK
jgi:hypothetical protein